jgi:AmmeMemoRadiSam system protein A
MELTLTSEEQKCLLNQARESIAARLEGRAPQYTYLPEVQERINDGTSALLTPCGAFVTLHKGKALRGCIGRMIALRPLQETVRDMALAAAFDDPRFPPLRRGELEECTIEISALSPMERCYDPRSVVVGQHGLYLVHKGHAGVLLPQVPVEEGWNLDEYLDYICYKAGLPKGAYNEPGAELYTFTALVFSERDS